MGRSPQRVTKSGPKRAFKRTAKVFRFFKWSVIVVGVAMLCTILWILVPLRSTVEPMTAGEDAAYWTLRDGHRIGYRQVGMSPELATAPPIVFLHGGPGGYVHSSAVAVIDAAARRLGATAYLYDQIGSGLSDRLAKPKQYSFLRHIEDLHEIVREVIDRPVMLVGQSYGGNLASWFTTYHSELVVATVLASPGELNPPLFDEEGRYVPDQLYPVPADLPFRDALNIREEMSPWSLPLRGIASMALAMVNVKLMSDREADGQLNQWATRFTKGLACDPANVPPEEGGGGFYAHIWSNWFGGLEDPRERMRTVQVPVLVLQGACDTVGYSSAYEYADLYPRGRYLFLADAGHDIWWDKPDEFVDHVATFFARATKALRMQEAGREGQSSNAALAHQSGG